MSQEDIEALMENLDFKEASFNTEQSDSEKKLVNTTELEKLIAENQKIEESDEALISKASIDKIDPIDKNNKINEIEDLLTDIDSKNDEPMQKDDKHDELIKKLKDSKIDLQSVPFSMKNNTNVVDQLDEVAHDSEEKVSQLFDVLSFNLENNEIFKKTFLEYNSAIEEEIKMLSALNAKFPNISLFKDHLEKIQKIKNSISIQQTILEKENNLILQAIDLMQFDDINRQKIQKVMLIIKKLSLFLNNLFENNEFALSLPDIKISNNENNEFIGNELDELIKNFQKKS